MKKLMIAAAIVCAAAVSQAATFSWSTSTKLQGVVAADVIDNGNYTAAASGTVNRGDKVLGGLGYTLTLFIAGTQTEVGKATGTIEYATGGKVSTSGITIDAAAAETTYDYTFVLTGDQTNLSGRGEEAKYDYSDAIVSATYNGSIKTALMGATDLTMDVPSSWTVSGIKEVEQTPEPTSGLLMLIGMAGLALRRKQK